MEKVIISQEEFWSENDLIAKAIHFAAEKHGSVINKESTPEFQGWYYKGIVKALSPLDGMKMYSEFFQVVKELYGE